ncbi:MAG: aspartate aminotransferase family protein [Gammaproteobacteria bacterium]
MSSHLMATYARLPVAFERGEGAWLWDLAGNKYLDAVSGVAVCVLGHAHPVVAQAISEQAHKLLHTSNLYEIPIQNALAEILTRLAEMDRVFFCNSGAEANEAAIKIARAYGRTKFVRNPAIAVMEGSFHGRTLATLSASGNRKVQAGFEPLVSGFVRVPFNDAEALTSIARTRPDVVAVLLEPIQGEGGVVIPASGYLSAVRAICEEQGWLMMLDEVQTGMCRTGEWFAFQHEGIRPDVVALAKGMGNGLPIGACLARGIAATVLQTGSHGSTFGGNPLASRAALTTISVLKEQRLAERAKLLGQRMLSRLQDAFQDLPVVREVRGKGLMIGIELDRPCMELVALSLSAGLLINVTAERVIRLLPPLILSEAEADQIVDSVVALVVQLRQAADD